MMSLGSIHRRNAVLYPDKVAFRFGDATRTFGEYNERGARFANALAGLGVGRGVPFAVMTRNCLEILDCYGAADKGGAILAPMNFRLTAVELGPILTRLAPKAVVVQGPFVELFKGLQSDGVLAGVTCIGFQTDSLPEGWLDLEELLAGASTTEPVEPEPGDIAYVIYTSGTTGIPRAACLTHGGQWAVAGTLALEMALVPTDVHFGLMPLYHGGGRAIQLSHTLRGATVIVNDGWETESVLRGLADHRITTTQVVPTMVTWLLDRPDLPDYDLSALRLVWYASAPMPVALLKRAIAAFGNVFMQGYGQTEAGPLVTAMHIYEHEVEGPNTARLASCGRDALNVELRIVDETGNDVPRGEIGELAVRSPFIMTGYLKMPEDTAAALRGGWLFTSDLGYQDSDGYVYLVDRKRDMVISGGENIYPREIEEVLFQHPAVLEVAVIGVPDDVWGEAIKAYVVPKAAEGGRAAAEVIAELTAYCRANLAGYKRPKSMEIIPELPKNPSGKILKTEFRKRAREAAQD